jgi:hypothetical protein
MHLDGHGNEWLMLFIAIVLDTSAVVAVTAALLAGR